MSTTFPDTTDGVVDETVGTVTPGPAASDQELTGWRDAVATGGLPQPAQSRWQVLRAGVVNLWEFDVAEYWFADGRGQFVGANQSGKSTLMALTTLTMLAGELGRQYIDTFGESEKSFRYYVEPTDDPRDRRDTSTSTNRGWAWVEYGRLGDGDTPEFFTTLLYAQAKRGVKAMPPTWVICRGSARVRGGLTQCEGQHVGTPAQLGNPDGLAVCESGTQYAARLARELFGFTDADRYATVLEMLKVLRTPHLGQRLNPGWFTEQMRTALPPIAQAEIDELAEGWQQLEQLGRDRDTATEAREAVTDYLKRGWRPWIDAVLRLRADELVAASDAAEAAGQAVRDTAGALDEARGKLTAEQGNTDQLLQAANRAQAGYEEALQSQAYRGAAARTLNAQRLRGEAEQAKTRAGQLVVTAAQARRNRDAAVAARERLQKAAVAAGQHAEAVAEQTAAKVMTAGLPESAPRWVADGDTARLYAAIKSRKDAIPNLRRLIRAAGTASARLNTAEQRVTDTQAEFDRRELDAGQAATGVETGVQQLSEGLERWALPLAGAAPSTAVREHWMSAVTDQVRSVRPTAVLATLIRTGWLEPAVAPLNRQATTFLVRAEHLNRDADTYDRDADARESAGDPEPAHSGQWTRRERPPFPAAGGAPLWRLLDPIPGTDQAVIDHVEAALDAAGLLDAWVTPDRIWAAGRDGDDSVVTLADPVQGGSSLAAVLQPAHDADALHIAAEQLLAAIGFSVGDDPLTAAVAIAADGRWRTPTATGRAGRSSHGAQQLGVAARVAARRREIAELREKAHHARAEAEQLKNSAQQLQERADDYAAAAAGAPLDADLVAAAITSAAAHRELDTARTRLELRQNERASALERVDLANAEMLRYAGDQRLPSNEDMLDQVTAELDKATESVAELRGAFVGRDTADREHHGAAGRAETAQHQAAEAERDHLDALEAAAAADQVAGEAEQSIGDNDQQQLARVKHMAIDRDNLNRRVKESRDKGVLLAESAATAKQVAAEAQKKLTGTVERRDTAATSWWIPVEAGVAASRGIAVDDDRTLPAALRQAQTAVQKLRPAQWPETTEEKARRVETALQKALGTELSNLRMVLESSGGRSVITVEPDTAGGLTSVAVLVDASGTQLSPADAIEHLNDQIERLIRSHDEKMNSIFTELLSSTFVDHLRDRLKSVIRLLKLVNSVLERHPTGASKTTMRLRRTAAEGHRTAFEILNTLEHDSVESDTVQQQIRTFLADRIREAQDAGNTGEQEWTDHLAELLDYRRWFDVVADFKVGAGKFQPFTKEVHGVDSGGGKVVTLLQPLLATLVALYEESPIAPRPLWLDEAFVGVDPENRAAMLDLLVDFRLDFLMAGPSQLVAAVQVPAAALWFVRRAPAPTAGVDLSLALWAGNTLERIPVADMAAKTFTPKPQPPDAGPDLFTTLATDHDEPGVAHTDHPERVTLGNDVDAHG